MGLGFEAKGTATKHPVVCSVCQQTAQIGEACLPEHTACSATQSGSDSSLVSRLMTSTDRHLLKFTLRPRYKLILAGCLPPPSEQPDQLSKSNSCAVARACKTIASLQDRVQDPQSARTNIAQKKSQTGYPIHGPSAG